MEENRMDYIMVYNGYTVDNPAITAMPKFIYLVLDTLGGPIDLYASNSEATAEEFKEQVTMPIRREMRKWGYKVVTATKDGKAVKPLMYHIPCRENTTIKFTEYETSISIEKADIKEAVERMSEDDITVNEVLDDVIGIRHYKEYQDKLEKIKNNVEETKHEVYKIENKSVKELLNM